MLNTQDAVQAIPDTNVGYVILRDADYEPDAAVLGAAFDSPADRVKRAAIAAGWTHLVHPVYGLTADGEAVTVELFRRAVVA